MPNGFDTETEIYFYEHDYYIFSNFSAFQVTINGIKFPTSEHAYQWFKFQYLTVDDELYNTLRSIRDEINTATSAHGAFKIAEAYKDIRDPDWDYRKVTLMKIILRAKIAQHPYVKKKLMDSYPRTLIENSWRDDFWGWGPNKDGQNMLGRLWMELRDELMIPRVDTV